MRLAETAGSPREFRLTAAISDADLGGAQIHRTWLYNGSFPGPQIHVREGERIRCILENRLPEPTTIHWHGIPVPNAMDGVPSLTQKPVPPGETFVYDYIAEPAGSYIYHSHADLQIDRGLFGSLIVDEYSPHVAYDREFTVVVDDFLRNSPEPIDLAASRMRGMMGTPPGETDRMRGVPGYDGFLLNGRLSSDPVVFEVSQGEMVRLRLMNPSGATIFRMSLGGHRLRITHTDGRPVHPCEVDALLIGPGERYDVVVEANNPGKWTLLAASVNGGAGAARAALRYLRSTATRFADGGVPEGNHSGRVLSLDDLVSVDLVGENPGSPDRTFDLVLSGGMMRSRAWTIDGHAYPAADSLDIRRGERIRVTMLNRSMAYHPMHLHGHFFRVGGVLKDTVMVPPHMGRVSFEFVADHPGNWLFHCHNLYHMESGMARVFHYVA